MSVLSKAVVSCALTLGGHAFAALPFSNFTVSPGNWVVTSEVNGLPGRGMGIEVRDNTLVMAVYNYNSTGKATFHLTAGAMSGNFFNGQLQAFKGGRYLGSGARDAAADGSAGPVAIQFTSSTTGILTFPGEPPVSISRYEFDGPPVGKFMKPGEIEFWFLTELDASNLPIESAYVMAGYDDNGKLSMGDGSMCAVGAASGIAICTIGWQGNTSKPATVELQRFGRQVEGTIIKLSTPSVRNRLVGSRLALFTEDAAGGIVIDSSAATLLSGGQPFPYSPEAGMWIISSENTGNPGRGMSLDLQSHLLVMQLYGYESDGSPTFHIGSGKYAASESSIKLLKVRGGRYYGSGALSGTENGNDGDAVVRFSSPTTGQIKLPGEPWADMQKFSVGAIAPMPESLLGNWVLWAPNPDAKIEETLDLTAISGGAATTSGGARCRYEATAQGSVRCTETFTISGRGTVYSYDYRFTPTYGQFAGAGVAMNISKTTGQPIETEKGQALIIQRIVDRNRVVSGSLDRQ